MSTLLSVLLIVIIVASLAFLFIVVWLWYTKSAAEADLWLRPMAAALLIFTTLAGIGALATGYFAGKDLEVKILGLERGNIDAQRALYEAKLKTLEVEKSVAPREIALTVGGFTVDGKPSVDSLRDFKGQKVVIQFLPDFEPKRATAELQNALTIAGWQVLSVTPNPELEHGLFNGVVVEVGHGFDNPAPDEERALWEQRQKSTEAEDSLVRFLDAHNWAAHGHAGTGTKPELPPDTLRISVGFKPSGISPWITALERATRMPILLMPQPRPEPRSLTETQFHRAGEALRSFSFRWRRPVEIKCPADNEEACKLAQDIFGLLKSQDRPVTGDVVRASDIPKQYIGIVIIDPLQNGSSQCPVVLFSTLRNAGFEVGILRNTQGGKDDPVRLVVGW